MQIPRRVSLPRLLAIHDEVKANRYPNVVELAERLGWSEKTIRRDFDLLRDLGAPLAYNPNRRGFYYTRDDFRFPSIAVTEGELIGIFLGTQLLHQYEGTDLGRDLVRLFAKLLDFLPEPVEIDLNDLRTRFSVRAAATEPIDPAILQALMKAVHNRTRLDVIYYTASRDLTQRRLIDPYGFSVVDGDCYVVAHCHLREDVRIFHPGRIRELTPTTQTFERPADFHLSRFLDDGFRQMRGSGPLKSVTLRFSPAIARFVQHRTWHPSQRSEVQPDRSLLVHFNVNHLLEVKRLALSFGPDCEVLEPMELRAEMERDVRRMMETYENRV